MIRLAALGLVSGLIAPSCLAALYSVGLDKTQYTSDFMIGKVVASVIFVESDGTHDPNLENWSEERKSLALSKVMAGLDWWTRQNPRSPLTFTYDVKTVTTRYEPITRPYYDEALWIPEIMAKLGHTGTRFASTRAYINSLRDQHDADWGFMIFIVDSLVDINGKFADGFFAYAYLGGPFMVMTYDNNGYGISNMDVVTAHEVGHIFNALDQYAGASSPHAYSMGYFPTINGNHAYSATANTPDSIMRGGIRWGMDDWTRQMVGWRDSKNNNRDDIVDVTPLIDLGSPALSSSDGHLNYTGLAKVRVLPRQSHPQGHGLTVDSIAKVEYRTVDGNWALAEPLDGQFDGPEEMFKISLTPSEQIQSQSTSAGSSNMDIRVVTAFATHIGPLDSSGDSGALANAHPFPNPFKPNSNLGHTPIRFSGLIAGSKVQVFTPAGDAIFEKTTLTNELEWTESHKIASGVYFYLVTDENGNKKKGKLAILR